MDLIKGVNCKAILLKNYADKKIPQGFKYMNNSITYQGKSIGLRHMHPMQVEAFMNLIGVTLELAVKVDDKELLANVEFDCDELVRLFGGNGVKVTIEPDTVPRK